MMIHAELWNRLAAKKSADVARRAWVRPNEDGSYDLEVLNEVYRVDVHARSILRIHPPIPAEPDLHCWLAALVYLIEAKDVDPVGEWVSPRQLAGGYAFFRGLHAIPVDQIIERFGNNKRDFELACQRSGGHPEQYADAAYSFRLFPRLPVAVLLWLQDEEFPARATMLVDKTAGRHFPLDALLAALDVVQNSVVVAAPDFIDLR